MRQTGTISRRSLLAGAATWAGAAWMGRRGRGDEAAERAAARRELAADRSKALVAITLDLEMSRNFPAWTDTHWDYEKGNLDEPTKRYTVEAARRIKAAGGVLHAFAVGRVFEQADVDWMKDLARAGHSIGNHTYDHINVRAQRPEELQYRFQRAPWLLRKMTVPEAIEDNVAQCTAAMKNRLGIVPAGFRTPGGFSDGLAAFPEVRAMLRRQGFEWTSSLYPGHPIGKAEAEPTAETIDAIVAAQAKSQPFIYPDGLIEVPMSPISDIGAFRTGRWKLDWFLRAIQAAVEWAIEQRAVFDFLGHPSCLYVVDPEFRTIDMICDLVRKAENRAAIVDLGTIARQIRG
jgi:peptidoglycan/xylan/chitin deacetylase (PgdA/CDA1 family)